jgi:hypothetical protein
VNESIPNRRRDYQHRVLSEAGLNPLHYEAMIKIWWRNPTNPNSLRLTHYGLKFFVDTLKQPSHTVKLAEPFKSKHLLQLERLFTAPYYVRNNALELFSEQDAIMLQLHAGNLGQYLDNLQTNT